MVWFGRALRAYFPTPVVERFDLSSLDTIYFNAAALPVELKQWVMETFPHVGVHELYGSTEGGIITNLRPADAQRSVCASVSNMTTQREMSSSPASSTCPSAGPTRAR